jgi:hypothetical protein
MIITKLLTVCKSLSKVCSGSCATLGFYKQISYKGNNNVSLKT